MIRAALLALGGCFCLNALAGEGGDTLEAALAEARARQQPVLVSFTAPWCYSCYYMSQHVLTGNEWSDAQARMVHLTLDADAPEGARLRETREVAALPSYLVLNAAGEEIGRITGEQTRLRFYAQLEALTAQQDGAAQRETLARSGRGAEAAAAAAAVLEAYHARRAADAGLRWWQGLPEDTRTRLTESLAVQTAHDRLAFLEASHSGSPQQCVALGGALLATSPLGCEAAYELGRQLDCADRLSEAERQGALQPLQKRLTAEIEHLLADAPEACADGRSLIATQVRLHRALQDTAAADALLDRAIGHHQRALARSGLSDRHRADDLRVYLELRGDEAARDALLRAQIEAFPDTYIYAFRLGRALLARGDAEAALPLLAQAAEHAYGINRLRVAEQRALALQALGQPVEARRVVMAALKANGPWFSEDAARLRALVTGNS